MPVDPQLINVFGDDLGDILTALEEGLNPQVQQLLSETLNTLQFDTKIFADQIEKRVSMLAGAGMDEKAIKTILNEDLKTGGRIFGELRNSIKGGMVQSVNQAGRAGQMEAYKPTELLAWVTVGGHKVCPDCDARAGQTGTIEFWEANGLPGSGWSVCQGFCYCVLDPTGKIDTRVQRPGKPDITEKGAKIRPKAPTGSKLEKGYYRAYKLTKNQIAEYERILKLDTPTGQAMLKRIGKTRNQVYSEFAKVRNKLANLGATIDKYYNPKTKTWTKSRSALHQRIAEKIARKGKIKVDGKWVDFDLPIAKAGEQEFFMTGGYPGSGKSTMLDHAFPGWQKKFVHIDSDMVKQLLAEADGIDNLGWRAAAYHEEASAVVKRIMNIARAENRHILYDATMKSQGKAINLINEYIKRGYQISTAFADLPMDQAIERAIARFFGTSARFVDPIYIVTHGNQNIGTFEALKDYVLSWAQYNTNVPYNPLNPNPPILVNSFP